MNKQVGCKQKKENKCHPYSTKKFGRVKKEIKGWNMDVGNDKISVEIC
jgi:hypothetical protein